ncbi:MAG TPA: 2'-5' RNA ligase family protein [Parafilimonas sp.]|nr:2'-5' RNA ligase family protein [Parafilimonas sp.]
MSHSEYLYFIALIPHSELQEKITAFKQDFANRFNSKKALKVFPHITLKAPFKFSPGIHAELLRWFNDLHLLQKPFSIQLKNFGAFENKRNPVVFVQPILTKELQALQQQLIASFDSVFPGNVHPTDLDFHPHITIAYRDLSFETFKQAWSEYKYKSFDATFKVEAVYLLQHDLKKWNIIATHNLKQDIPAF